MEILKKILKSRTVKTALLQAVVGILLIVQAEKPELDFAGITAVIKSIYDIALRLDTKTSILEK